MRGMNYIFLVLLCWTLAGAVPAASGAPTAFGVPAAVTGKKAGPETAFPVRVVKEPPKRDYRTYQVVAIVKPRLTVRDEKGDIFYIEEYNKDYKVGDHFRYYSEKENKYFDFTILAMELPSITLKDKDGELLTITKDPKGFSVGDTVRYDKITTRLRKK